MASVAFALCASLATKMSPSSCALLCALAMPTLHTHMQKSGIASLPSSLRARRSPLPLCSPCQFAAAPRSRTPPRSAAPTSARVPPLITSRQPGTRCAPRPDPCTKSACPIVAKLAKPLHRLSALCKPRSERRSRHQPPSPRRLSSSATSRPSSSAATTTRTTRTSSRRSLSRAIWSKPRRTMTCA